MNNLELIAEAVRYSQRVKKMGMPASCYTRALREPIFFLWECRNSSKRWAAKFRSIGARGLVFGSGQLCYDHAIPFRYLQEELLALPMITEEVLLEALGRHDTTVLITKEEDVRLSKAGYSSRMPEGWDGIDPLARYKAVGIELEPNVIDGAIARGDMPS